MEGIDTGEAIRQLQALADLRTSDFLTDDELGVLKRRVLSSASIGARIADVEATESELESVDTGSAAGNGHLVLAGQNPMSRARSVDSKATTTRAKSQDAGANVKGAPAPLPRRAPKGSLVTTLKVLGTVPITYNVGNGRRPAYTRWKQALATGAAQAAAEAKPTAATRFSLRVEMRLYDPASQGSDLDNYVKPVQDALAEQKIFGPSRKSSPKKGDEHVDHLDVRRRQVGSEAKAGVIAEVWAFEE